MYIIHTCIISEQLGNNTAAASLECQHLDRGVVSPVIVNVTLSTVPGALVSSGWWPPAYTLYMPGSIT